MTRILIAEDEPPQRRAYVRMLAGSEIVEAESAEDALEILEREDGTFDLVISDNTMNGPMTGVEFLRTIATRWPRIARIFATGGSAKESIESLHSRCPIGTMFLPKPSNTSEFARVVRGALEPKTETEHPKGTETVTV